MPRFTATPPVSGFSCEAGSFQADESGIFELPLDAGVMGAFEAHGITLKMLDEDAKAIEAENEATFEQQREIDRVAEAEAAAAAARAEADAARAEADEKIAAAQAAQHAAEERAAALEAKAKAKGKPEKTEA